MTLKINQCNSHSFVLVRRAETVWQYIINDPLEIMQYISPIQRGQISQFYFHLAFDKTLESTAKLNMN